MHQQTPKSPRGHGNSISKEHLFGRPHLNVLLSVLTGKKVLRELQALKPLSAPGPSGLRHTQLLEVADVPTVADKNRFKTSSPAGLRPPLLGASFWGRGPLTRRSEAVRAAVKGRCSRRGRYVSFLGSGPVRVFAEMTLRSI